MSHKRSNKKGAIKLNYLSEIKKYADNLEEDICQGTINKRSKIKFKLKDALELSSEMKEILHVIVII